MHNCPHCGRPLSPRATACPACGDPGPGARPAVTAVVAAANRTDGYAIASIVCSASAFLGTFVFGSILGIILGRMSRTRLAADPDLEGEGLAKTGVLLGWVGVGLAVLFLLLGLAMFAPAARSSGILRVGF
ncbi:MAG: DUF4190 domain-containing protein [Acidimicrobiia bacterium]